MHTIGRNVAIADIMVQFIISAIRLSDGHTPLFYVLCSSIHRLIVSPCDYAKSGVWWHVLDPERRQLGSQARRLGLGSVTAGLGLGGLGQLWWALVSDQAPKL